MNVKDSTGRLARCSLLLQQYYFEIIHHPGKEHSNADSLSLRPYRTGYSQGFIEITSKGRSPNKKKKKTRQLQRRDPELSEIIEYLESDVVPLNDKRSRKILLIGESFYIGQDGLLYHVDQNQNRSDHDSFSQLLIPQALKFEIIII